MNSCNFVEPVFPLSHPNLQAKLAFSLNLNSCTSSSSISIYKVYIYIYIIHKHISYIGINKNLHKHILSYDIQTVYHLPYLTSCIFLSNTYRGVNVPFGLATESHCWWPFHRGKRSGHGGEVGRSGLGKCHVLMMLLWMKDMFYG